MILNTVSAVLALARKHASNLDCRDADGARFTMNSAYIDFANGHHDRALHQALRSLRYSVGVFHVDYQRAEKAGQSLAKKMMHAVVTHVTKEVIE